MQMEVEEEKQHEGIQQYYVTKIEALQVKYTVVHIDEYQRQLIYSMVVDYRKIVMNFDYGKHLSYLFVLGFEHQSDFAVKCGKLL